MKIYFSYFIITTSLSFCYPVIVHSASNSKTDISSLVSLESILQSIIDPRITLKKYTDDLESELFKDLKLKFKQISDNYSYSQSSFNEIQFISEDGLGCVNSKKSQPTEVAKILYQDSRAKENTIEHLTEYMTYYGCDQRPLFQEISHRKGFALSKLSKKDVLEFRRNLSLSDTELEKTYEIKNYEGQNFLSYHIHRFTYLGYETIRIRLSLFDQQVLEIIEQKNSERLFLTIKLLPYNFRSQFYNETNASSFSGNVYLYIDITNQGEKYFTGLNKDIVSKKNFESYYNSYILQFLYSNTISQQFKSIIKYLPNTEVISTGQNHSKLSRQLEEIRLNLINNTNLVKVRNDIEQILLDVLAGTIQDFRPQ